MKVLVVEDEWLVRELIVGELLDAGFDVVEAESGEAALARYHEHNPDVLFTDIRLPGQIDDWDVAERCRASNSDLPVVYATGYSSCFAIGINQPGIIDEVVREPGRVGEQFADRRGPVRGSITVRPAYPKFRELGEKATDRIIKADLTLLH